MGGTFDVVLTSERLGSSTQLAVGTVWVGGVGTCTLLGPEGPGADRAGFRTGGGWWLFLWASCCACRLVGVGRGSARTLRTTQWTRASLT